MKLQALINGLKAHKNGAASYESVDEAIRVFEVMLDVDGEKVVKGLECCIKRQPYTCVEMCPYHDDAICVMKLRQDALALIRQQQERIAELEAAQTARVLTLEAAQTARVMTLEEVENALDTVVWVEEPEFENFADHYALVMAYGHKEGFVRVYFGFADMPVTCGYKYDNYGKKWRCWTQRPTDEQRKAVRWNE